jgi:hypothetical protein
MRTPDPHTISMRTPDGPTRDDFHILLQHVSVGRYDVEHLVYIYIYIYIYIYYIYIYIYIYIIYINIYIYIHEGVV